MSTYSYRLVSRGDSSAFWALFTDNLVNLMVLSGVCRFVFDMPGEVVYGRIVPGAAVAILAGVAVYVVLARRAARRLGRDVTALPYGISTPVMFVYLFGVIGPIYWSTDDALLAWQVGIAAGLIGGLVAASGALVGPWLKRVTPRAGMLGTLCGIALVFIGAVPLAEVFESPVIGFTAMIVVLWGLVGRFRLPFGLPAGLLAIGLGTAAALATGQSTIDVSGTGLYLPVPWLGDMAAGLSYLAANPDLLLVLVPVQIYNFIETMNNVESAEAAGDPYPVGLCQLTDGAGTMIGAVFGSPFPTTVYIGHPAYRRMGARAGYVMGVGAVVAVSAVFGLLALFNELIPIAAAAPILVFVAISLVADTARNVRPEHMAAVAIAVLPHVSAFLITKWTSMLGALREAGAEGLPELGDPGLTAALLQEGAHYEGHLALSQGAIITGLVWGAIVASVIDARFRNAAGFAAAAAAMSALGIVHAPALRMPQLDGVTAGYLIAAAFLALYPRLARVEPDTGEAPTAPSTPAE